MSVQRIEVLGVPVDVCTRTELEEKFLELLEDSSKPKQIVFLTIWDLMRARRNVEFADCLKKADLVIPLSKSILKGAVFLGKTEPVRHNPFTILISFISIIEQRLKSFYILGGRKKALITAESNVRATFRSLHIVGRYIGYYKKEAENDIVSAIFKAAPSLVLLSDGIKEKDMWAYNRQSLLNKNGIFLYYHDAVGIFSKRVKRPSEKTFNKGREIWYEILRKPGKMFLFITFLWYLVLLLWNKIFHKEK